MVKTAAEALGGLDIVIANAAWTKFEDKFGDLETGLTDDEWDKVGRRMAN
jgi:NAD(P)-dependent dehydrogenase (short-subunit alcohol dehydrogenase family)